MPKPVVKTSYYFSAVYFVTICVLAGAKCEVSGAGMDLSERLLTPGLTCRHSLAAVRSELSIAARFRNVPSQW